MVFFFLSLPKSKYSFQVIIFGNAQVLRNSVQWAQTSNETIKAKPNYNNEGNNLLLIFISSDFLVVKCNGINIPEFEQVLLLPD